MMNATPAKRDESYFAWGIAAPVKVEMGGLLVVVLATGVVTGTVVPGVVAGGAGGAVVIG